MRLRDLIPISLSNLCIPPFFGFMVCYISIVKKKIILGIGEFHFACSLFFEVGQLGYPCIMEFFQLVVKGYASWSSFLLLSHFSSLL